MVPPPIRPSSLASSDRTVDLDPPLLSPRPRSWSASQRAMGYEVESPAAAERMLQAHFGLGGASHGRPDVEDRTSSSATTTTPSGWPGSDRSSNEIDPRSDSSSSAYHSAPSQPSAPASPLPGSPEVLSPSPQSAAARQVLATLASMTRRPREDEDRSGLEGDWGPLGRTRGRSLSVLEERTEEATSAGDRTGSHRQGSGGESERATHSGASHDFSPSLLPAPPATPQLIRSQTPDLTPPRASPANPTPSRARSSSPSKRDREALPPPSKFGAQKKSAADLIALFEGGRKGNDQTGGTTTAAPLLLHNAGPPPSAFIPTVASSLQRKSYLATLSSPRVSNPALPTPSSPISPARRSVFDLPQFNAPAPSGSTTSPRPARPSLFPLRSWTVDEKGKSRARSDTSSPELETLTPKPLPEAALPPLPQEVLNRIPEKASKSPLQKVASVLGRGSNLVRRGAVSSSGRTQATTGTEGLSLVRRARASSLVRSLSRKKRSASTSADESGEGHRLGGEREMREQVDPGVSFFLMSQTGLAGVRVGDGGQGEQGTGMEPAAGGGSGHLESEGFDEPGDEIGAVDPAGGGSAEALRVGHLHFLNVHDPQQSPTNLPQWVRCDAQLFPTSLHLQWPTPLGRAQAQIDLVHFVEVRSVPSPGHPSAQDDIGTAAALQYPFLAENLYPFLIVYADGMERLGCESALERTRWVGAIWDVLNSRQAEPRGRSRSPSLREPRLSFPSTSPTRSRTTSYSSIADRGPPTDAGSLTTQYRPGALRSVPEPELPRFLAPPSEAAEYVARRTADDSDVAYQESGLLEPRMSRRSSWRLGGSGSGSLRRVGSEADLDIGQSGSRRLSPALSQSTFGRQSDRSPALQALEEEDADSLYQGKSTTGQAGQLSVASSERTPLSAPILIVSRAELPPHPSQVPLPPSTISSRHERATSRRLSGAGSSTSGGFFRSPTSATQLTISDIASEHSYDAAFERDLERSSTISSVTRSAFEDLIHETELPTELRAGPASAPITHDRAPRAADTFSSSESTESIKSLKNVPHSRSTPFQSTSAFTTAADTDSSNPPSYRSALDPHTARDGFGPPFENHPMRSSYRTARSLAPSSHSRVGSDPSASAYRTAPSAHTRSQTDYAYSSSSTSRVPPSVPSSNSFPTSSSSSKPWSSRPPTTPSSARDVRSTETELSDRSLQDLSSDIGAGSSSRGRSAGSQPVNLVGGGVLNNDLDRLLRYLQQQEQSRLGRDALQVAQLEFLQQSVLTIEDHLSAGPPLPPKDPSDPTSSSSSSSSSSTARQPTRPEDRHLGTIASVLEMLQEIRERQDTLMIGQVDVQELLADENRRRREEREAKAAETGVRNVTLHRLDDLLRRILWLMGDEVYHGEGGPPSEKESIYGPEVRSRPSHPPASIHDLVSDEEPSAWEGSSFISRPTWRSSQADTGGDPPPTLTSDFATSSLPSSSERSTSSSEQPSTPSFSSLPSWSPSAPNSLLDEQDRRWDEIRRNRSLPRRPASAISSSSTIKAGSVLDEALAELAQRARDLQNRERRLDDEEFNVRENAEAQAQWLANEEERLRQEEDRLREAEDALVAAHAVSGESALQHYDETSQLSDGYPNEDEERERRHRHPTAGRPDDDFFEMHDEGRRRRPLPPPRPIDLPSPVFDGRQRPPDFDRPGPSRRLPYPERIVYPQPEPGRSRFADYGTYPSRYRTGLFSNWFPRRARGFSYNSPGYGGSMFGPNGRGGTGWPSHGRSLHGRDRSGSDHSSSSSDDLRRQQVRQQNEIAERLNDIEKDIRQEGREHHADSQALNASIGRLPSHGHRDSLDSAGNPRTLDDAARRLAQAADTFNVTAGRTPGPALFDGHPATHLGSLSRHSSSSDKQPNVTINVPPGTQAPQPPVIARPSSPGFLGHLKDLAGPAIGGIAGAALGDRFGRKEDEKEHREDRKEDRKAAAEERRAEQRAERDAARRPPVAPIAAALPVSTLSNLHKDANEVEEATREAKDAAKHAERAANTLEDVAKQASQPRPAPPVIIQPPASASDVSRPANNAQSVPVATTANVPSARLPAVSTVAPLSSLAAAAPSRPASAASGARPLTRRTTTTTTEELSESNEDALSTPATSVDATAFRPLGSSALANVPKSALKPTSGKPVVVVPPPAVVESDGAPVGALADPGSGASTRTNTPRPVTTAANVPNQPGSTPRPTTTTSQPPEQPFLSTIANSPFGPQPLAPKGRPVTLTTPASLADPGQVLLDTAGRVVATAPGGTTVVEEKTETSPSGKVTSSEKVTTTAPPALPLKTVHEEAPPTVGAFRPGNLRKASTASLLSNPEGTSAPSNVASSVAPPKSAPVGGPSASLSKPVSESAFADSGMLPTDSSSKRPASVSSTTAKPQPPGVPGRPAAPIIPQSNEDKTKVNFNIDNLTQPSAEPSASTHPPLLGNLGRSGSKSNSQRPEAVGDGSSAGVEEKVKVDEKIKSKPSLLGGPPKPPVLTTPARFGPAEDATAPKKAVLVKDAQDADKPPLAGSGAPSKPGVLVAKPSVPAERGVSGAGKPTVLLADGSKSKGPPDGLDELKKVLGDLKDMSAKDHASDVAWQKARVDAEAKMSAAINKLVAEREAEKAMVAKQAEDAKKSPSPSIRNVLDELEKGKKEQQALLKTMTAEMDKAFKAAQKAATDEMKKTAKEQVAFNVAGHLDDFSKSLAGEVKTLMKEVGDLREAKRALQHELADLLLIKARHGAGDGMNLFPWQGPTKHAAAAAPKAPQPPKPAVVVPAPKAAAAPAPTAPTWQTNPWAFYGYPQPQAPAAPAPIAPPAVPKPPVVPPAAPTTAQAPPFPPPWAWGVPPAPTK